MKSTRLLSLCMMSFFLCSCVAIAKDAKGKEVTKQIPAKEFSAIDLKGAADIVYTQGTSTQVSVTAPEDIIGLVDVTVSGKTLIISTRKLEDKQKYRNFKITVNASTPLLNSVDVSGAGDIMLKGAVNLDQLGVNIKGAGDLKAEDLHCQDLNIDVKGAGDVSLNGTAKKAALRVRGAGDVNAFNFKVESLLVDVKGAGDVECNASELSINNSGAGDIVYKGNPVIKEMSNRGVGTIRSAK